MTANLLFVESPAHQIADSSPDPSGGDFVVARCEALSPDFYVYLVRPGSGVLEDTAGGVRILPYQLEALPGFGHLDGAIAIGDVSLLPLLASRYPGVPLGLWIPPTSAFVLDANARTLCAAYGTHVFCGELGEDESVPARESARLHPMPALHRRRGHALAS